jgi:hypothetical protein
VITVFQCRTIHSSQFMNDSGLHRGKTRLYVLTDKENLKLYKTYHTHRIRIKTEVCLESKWNFRTRIIHKTFCEGPVIGSRSDVLVNINLPFIQHLKLQISIPVAAWSKVRTVFGRSNSGIVGSNPTRGMDVYPLFSVLCSV